MSISRESNDLCDLAALYSLGALDDQGTWQFRKHLVVGCGRCSDDLETFDSVTQALAFSAAPAEPSPILRERLFGAIAGHAATFDLDAYREGPWEPHAMPGIWYRRLHVDERERRAVLVVRAEPGARYPAHRHAALEEMFMLEGELTFGDRTYRAGDYVRSECSTEHEASETPGGCMFLLRASLDNELVA